MIVPLLVTLLLHHTCGYIEIVPLSGCAECEIRLTCRHLEATIAVLEAKFEPLENITFEDSKLYLEELFLPIQPRVALNHRCSGKHHCSFNFSQDCPGADRYGSGNLSVVYACATERRVNKFCNREFILPNRGIAEGFVQSPGYPRYYLGQHECWWKFVSPQGQRIRVTLLDVALRSGGPSSTTCPDYLLVKDLDRELLSTCIQHDTSIELISTDNTLEVSLVSSSRGLVPRRGILFQYSAVGCKTPRAPKDGYLVHRNTTAAHYMCCVGYAFPDTGLRDRILTCTGYNWNAELPITDCSKLGKIDKISKHTKTIQDTDLSAATTAMKDNSIRDIYIPTIVIITLFIVNSIIVFTIHKFRQRKAMEEQDEELGAIVDDKPTEHTNA